MLITGGSSTLLTSLSELKSEFSMKDFGQVHYFLGIEVVPTTQVLFLSQHSYATQILKKTCMEDCKHISTLMASKLVVPLNSPSFADPALYRALVGYYNILLLLDLIWLML